MSSQSSHGCSCRGRFLYVYSYTSIYSYICIFRFLECRCDRLVHGEACGSVAHHQALAQPLSGCRVRGSTAGCAYTLTCTCTGFHPYGSFKERTQVDVAENHVHLVLLQMVPIKVGFVRRFALPNRLASVNRRKPSPPPRL